jgi:hypothetical protein
VEHDLVSKHCANNGEDEKGKNDSASNFKHGYFLSVNSDRYIEPVSLRIGDTVGKIRLARGKIGPFCAFVPQGKTG